MAPHANEKTYRPSSEKAPLLPFKKQDDEQYDGYNDATVSSAVFSLSTSIVGAGIMGLPSTMDTVGLIPGLILILLSGLLTNASIDFILKYSSVSRAVSYGGVMADSFGRIGRILLQLCIIINNFGLLVVYLIIIADVLSGSTSSSVHHSGVFEEWAGGQKWWNSRVVVMLLTTVFILAPLACFRHVDSLKLSSALSVALAVLFVVVTAAVAMYKLVIGTISTPKMFPDFSFDLSTIVNYFSVVPILVTAYICHHSVHPILNEMQDDTQSKSVVRISLVLCTVIYLATSGFGYLLFGENTLSDVLSNFDSDLGVPHSAILADIVRVGYAIHLMLVFPLLHFSLRLNVDGLIFPNAGPLSLDTRRFSILTAILVTSSFVAASFIPDIWDAFQITGSTSGVCLGFVFPGCLVLRDAAAIATKREKALALIMVVLAAGSSVIALSGDIYDILS
ncbi:hypothetical protein KP509_26G045500 [Ceratopteris richardii]|uniref:Amino acid transporter transmembrane domain-containing protein n=1 Tax=Ceratopteris richardii TaxID=49495 RepID=A0A8T2RM97_CERRI|nr:hypothetical protein KP509_26G045500 [Ceratopteris richardii]